MYFNYKRMNARKVVALIALVGLLFLRCKKDEEDEAGAVSSEPIAIEHQDVTGFFINSIFLTKLKGRLTDFSAVLDAELQGSDDEFFSSFSESLNQFLARDGANLENLFSDMFGEIQDVVFAEKNIEAGEDPNVVIYRPDPAEICASEEDSAAEIEECTTEMTDLSLSLHVTRTSTDNLTIALHTVTGNENMRLHISASEISLFADAYEIIQTLSKIGGDGEAAGGQISGSVGLSLKEESEGIFSFLLSTQGSFKYSPDDSGDPIDFDLPGTNEIIKFQVDTIARTLQYSMKLQEKLAVDLPFGDGMNLVGSIGPLSGSISSTLSSVTSNLNVDLQFGSRFIDLKTSDGNDYIVLDGKDGQPFRLNFSLETSKENGDVAFQLLEEFAFSLNMAGDEPLDLSLSMAGISVNTSGDGGSIAGKIEVSSTAPLDNSISIDFDSCAIEVSKTDETITQATIDSLASACQELK